ncbi:creatininase family protein [Terrihabitans sp. B22-R8]|uniref:creatininase family protein n=1 Tax=Terrihabitans sp. B22-R8 TaxID=3425128 RepID=UPI00403CA598
MKGPRRLWEEMAWGDFGTPDVADWIAVVPVAAIEQHGPHLPLSTDLVIMEGYLARVRARVPDGVPATFLPVQNVGLSPEHERFPGTLTLSAEAALKVWTGLGESVARTGVRKIVFVSSHGGNNALLDVVARELRLRHGMLAVTTAWARFGYPDGLFAPEEIAHGVHGGAIETSLMLAFRPDLVRHDRIADFPSAARDMERDYTHLRSGRPAGFGWLTQDLNSEGVLGDARAASTEKGEAAAEHGAGAFIELLHDVHRFPLANLKPGPLDDVIPPSGN